MSVNVSYLYSTYADWVYRKCFWYTNSADDAQDLTHDIFSDILKSLSIFEGKSTVFTWIYRITVNKCMAWLRKEYRNRERFSDYNEDVNYEFPGTHDIHQAIDMQKLLESFDEKTRTILFLYAFEGLTHEEISGVMKMSRRAVCKRLANLQSSMISKKQVSYE